MVSLLIAAALAVLLVATWLFLTVCHIPSLRTVRLFNKLPGPTHYPFFIGAVWEIATVGTADITTWMKKNLDKYNGIVAFYSLGMPSLFVDKPEYVETVLSSTTNTTKSFLYDLLKEWLNEGLLLSTGEKWRKRRKMLTPSFHFNILDGNMECMNRHWKETVKKLLETRGAPFDPLHIMGRGALNIICETAMGTTLDEGERGEEYINAIRRVNETTMDRIFNPLLRTNFVFHQTPAGKRYLKDLQVIHGFSERVIRDRRVAFLEEKKLQENEYKENEAKPQAFLDHLLDLSEKENLSDIDIREEVDTFMTAGHETTSTALQYALLFLGRHPEIQEKAYQEQVDIFGYSDRDATKADLGKMHYLEQVLKESLRLCPSAPQISRQVVEDITLHDGTIIPAGCNLTVCFFLLHRNPTHFPDPEKFDPDRFSPEASHRRHPYSYLPFSAGPRNCIGQKFAMLEMKIGLSIILRQCKINAVTTFDDFKFLMLISLKTTSPVLIEVTPRY